MGQKILTVDDSKMVRMIVARAFKTLDCEVVEAANGTEALASVESENPDLIILDITMPDMNGLDVLEKIRGESSQKETPVIMLTAESGNNTVERADQLGVSGYVAKPFKGEQLVELASKVLDL